MKGILKDSFRPEFLNRIDEVVIFSSLTKKDAGEIVDRLLVKTRELLEEQEIELVVGDGVKEFLVENGFSEEYGARPLRRLVQKEIENLLSSMLISGGLKGGDVAEVEVVDGKVVVKVKEPAAVPSS